MKRLWEFKLKFTFNDVLIEPQFNTVESRKDVNLKSFIGGFILDIPVISANMDTITDSTMARTMCENGGIGCLHRFYSIEDNVAEFKKYDRCIVSMGIGDQERERAKALYETGARSFCIDVAHGASKAVYDQLQWLCSEYSDVQTMVGNFASPMSVMDFLEFDPCGHLPHAIKVGIGPGSVCSTRIKTGCGYPQLSAIQDIATELKRSRFNIRVIADGGMKTPGDIAKALAAGADAVMIGGMLAGTDETPGQIIEVRDVTGGKRFKEYRGSASKESYIVQGKDDSWRTAEGVCTRIACKGPVKNIMQDIEGGLRSAFTYVGASNLTQFQANARFIRITTSTVSENIPHI